MISRATIDKVFEISRLEEVIGDFVQLKKSGSNFKGLSPFTDERTPSFMVSPAKQIWKDFSSGKGGNVISFLMEHEHFTYPEAIRFLAKKYGIEIEETVQTDEQKEMASERESLYLVSEFARDYFHDTLLNSDEGKAIGLSYFKERGFTDETIEKFKLGYSLNQWDAFTQNATKEGYSVSYLEKTGLTIVNADKQFDRFKGRVMFPIHSMSGRTLGFGGRILTNDKKQAKYINSPESDIYHKSKVLYGIYYAKQSIVKEDNCYLVEGYTDVIQFSQLGIQNVVSSSGTALTEDQIRLIRRLTSNITVLFDGDAAGIRASLRGIDLILEQGLNVRICTFPEGDDPDSFARKNSLEELTDFLKEQSQDFIAFKASLLASETKNDPIKRAETIRDIVVSIAKIPDVIKREVYIKECSRIMDISEEVLFNTQAQILLKEQKDRGKKVQKSQQAFEVVHDDKKRVETVNPILENERDLLEILLVYGLLEKSFEDEFIHLNSEGDEITEKEVVKRKICERIYLNLQEDEIGFSTPEFNEIYDLIVESMLINEDFEISKFINSLNEWNTFIVTDIIMFEQKYELHDWKKKDVFVAKKEDKIVQKVDENILRYRHLLILDTIRGLMDGINDKPKKEKEELIKQINDYNKLKNVLIKRLGGVLTNA